MCCQNMRSTCSRNRCGCSGQTGPTATLSLDDLQSYVIVPTSAFSDDSDTGTGCGCNCGCSATTRNTGCSCGSDW